MSFYAYCTNISVWYGALYGLSATAKLLVSEVLSNDPRLATLCFKFLSDIEVLRCIFGILRRWPLVSTCLVFSDISHKIDWLASWLRILMMPSTLHCLSWRYGRVVYPPTTMALSPFILTSPSTFFCHPPRKQFLDIVYAILCNLCVFSANFGSYQSGIMTPQI